MMHAEFELSDRAYYYLTALSEKRGLLMEDVLEEMINDALGRSEKDYPECVEEAERRIVWSSRTCV